MTNPVPPKPPPSRPPNRLPSRLPSPTPTPHRSPGGPPFPPQDTLGDALRAAVAEVEQFADADGWDRPRQMFALVRTEELLAHEPALIGQIGSDSPDPASQLTEFTPVQQGTPPGDTVAAALATIAWPDEIAGCVLVLEIGVENDGMLSEGRMAVGVMRDRPGGACALRWRHAPTGPVTYSPDLAPELIAALHATFQP